MRGAIKWTAVIVLIGALGVGWSAMTGNDGAPSDPPVAEAGPALDSRQPAVASLPPRSESSSSSIPTARPPEAAPFERSEAGARAAAVAYLELTEDAVSLPPNEAAAIQRSIATADFADEFGADTEQKMIELTQTIPGGIILRIAPIEVRSVAEVDDWLVSVWYAQAITMVGEAVVDDWRTAHYRMRWEEGTWKIAAFSSQRGPTPGRGTQPASASAVDFETLLDGYSDEGLG